MVDNIFLQRPSNYIEEWLIDAYKPANDKLRLVVETTANYKKSGIYSTARDDTSKPIVIDWGDGTVEQVNGDVSQKVHTYATAGTFNVVVENIKSYAASTDNYTWCYTTSQNEFTLKEIVAIPDNVTSIVQNAFSFCSGLTSVTISNSMTSIGDYAFKYCSSLTSMMIPNSVTSIGFKAFKDCDSLTSFVIQKTVAETAAMYNKWFESNSYSEFTITCTDGTYTAAVECFVKGTKILMADGTSKNVEDINYGDIVKVWDFDSGCISSAPVCWLTKPGLTNDHYYQLTFSDGTVLKTTGLNSNHKIYNIDTHKFEGIKSTEVGDRIYSANGVVTVTDKQLIEQEVEYYNLMTTGAINCFAEGILASNRYSNIYEVDSSMKYVKNDRQARPYSEFEEVGISRYFYDNLRLGEIDPAQEPMSKTITYIQKISSVMRALPET